MKKTIALLGLITVSIAIYQPISAMDSELLLQESSPISGYSSAVRLLYAAAIYATQALALRMLPYDIQSAIYTDQILSGISDPTSTLLQQEASNVARRLWTGISKTPKK